MMTFMEVGASRWKEQRLFNPSLHPPRKRETSCLGVQALVTNIYLPNSSPAHSNAVCDGLDVKCPLWTGVFQQLVSNGWCCMGEAVEPFGGRGC